jgi:hypothetical protein
MKSNKAFLSSVIVLAATVCAAGTLWHYKCSNPKCDFEGDFGIGGGFVFQQVTGFCTTCKKFISITWARKGTERMKIHQSTNLLLTAPSKIGTVWNAATGRSADLYACPDCKNAFMTIDNDSLIRGSDSSRRGDLNCPRCTNATLRFAISGAED